MPPKECLHHWQYVPSSLTKTYPFYRRFLQQNTTLNRLVSSQRQFIQVCSSSSRLPVLLSCLKAHFIVCGGRRQLQALSFSVLDLICELHYNMALSQELIRIDITICMVQEHDYYKRTRKKCSAPPSAECFVSSLRPRENTKRRTKKT